MCVSHLTCDIGPVRETYTDLVWEAVGHDVHLKRDRVHKTLPPRQTIFIYTVRDSFYHLSRSHICRVTLQRYRQLEEKNIQVFMSVSFRVLSISKLQHAAQRLGVKSIFLFLSMTLPKNSEN